MHYLTKAGVKFVEESRQSKSKPARRVTQQDVIHNPYTGYTVLQSDGTPMGKINRGRHGSSQGTGRFLSTAKHRARSTDASMPGPKGKLPG